MVTRGLHSNFGVQGDEGGGTDETSSAHGPEDGPGASQISLSCRREREGARSAAEGQGEFRASAAGGNKAQADLQKVMQEAPHAGNASSTSQHEPGQIFGSFGRAHRNMWNPEARQPPEHPDACNPGVEANSSDLFGSRLRRGAQLWTPTLPQENPSCGIRRKTTPRRWQTSRKTRTAAPVDAAQGGAQASQAQRLSARAMVNPKDTELLALSQRACAIIPALGVYHNSLHRGVGLLRHAPGETLASLL